MDNKYDCPDCNSRTTRFMGVALCSCGYMDNESNCPNCNRRTTRFMGVALCSCGYIDNEYDCRNCNRKTTRFMGVALCSCGYTRTSQSKNVTSKPECFSNQIVNSNTPGKGLHSDLRDVAMANQTSVKVSRTIQSENETSVLKSLANQNVTGKTDCKGLHSYPGEVGLLNQNRDLLPASRTTTETETTREEAFETIAKICDGLKLGATIRDRAKENYMKLIGKSATKGKKLNAILAACIDIACEQEGDKRTLREICYLSDGIAMKELVRAKIGIKEEYKKMGEIIKMKPVASAQYIRRYCSGLRMKEKAVRAAEEAMEKAEEIIFRRNRPTMAGVVISMVTQLSQKKELPLKDIARAVNCGQGTIRNAYREILPHASRLIPRWFAREEDLLNLSPCPSSENQHQSLASLRLNS